MKKIIKIDELEAPIWQILIALLIILAIVLSVIFITKPKKETKKYEEDRHFLDTSKLAIITNIDAITDELWNEENKKITNREKYEKNYNKYIANNNGLLTFDNINYVFYKVIKTKEFSITINKNKWFYFNTISNIEDSEEFYILGNDFNFYKGNIQLVQNAKDLEVEEYTIDNWRFYLDSKNKTTYGYLPIYKDSDNNTWYITINIDKIKMDEDEFYLLYKAIKDNIKVKETEISYLGLSLPDRYKEVKLNDNFTLDLNSNIVIDSWEMGISDKNNILKLSSKNSTSRKYIIEEILNTSIENYIKNKSYILYNYNDTEIYLKYNKKDYPEFSTSDGGITGLLSSTYDGLYTIDFEREYTFKSQEDLNEILSQIYDELVKR